MSQPGLQSATDIRRAVLLLLGVGGLLGTSAIVAKFAPAVGWSPLPLLQWSMLLGGALQLGLWLWRRGAIGSDILRDGPAGPPQDEGCVWF